MNKFEQPEGMDNLSQLYARMLAMLFPESQEQSLVETPTILFSDNGSEFTALSSANSNDSVPLGGLL